MAEQRPQEPTKGARHPTKFSSNSRSTSYSLPSASSQKRWSRRQAAEAFLSSIPIGRDTGESLSWNRALIRDVTFGSPVRGSMKHSSSASSFLSTATTTQDEEYIYTAIPGFRWSSSYETQTSTKEAPFENKEVTDSDNMILMGGTNYEAPSGMQEISPRNERHGLSEDHPVSAPSLPLMVFASTEITENEKPRMDYVFQKGDLDSLKSRLSDQPAVCRVFVGWKTDVGLLNFKRDSEIFYELWD